MTEFCNKNEARKYFRDLRNSIEKSDRAVKSNNLVDAFLDLPEYKNSQIILSYYPIKNEPLIDALIDVVVMDGKIIALPVSQKEERKLLFKTVNSRDELVTGEYNIPEPIGRALRVDELNDALCIVPALSFDINGNRLGYGGGYYDRFLESFRGVSVGLAFSDLITSRLPTDKYDQKVDIIITEKGEAYRNEKRKKNTEERQEASLLKGS